MLKGKKSKLDEVKQDRLKLASFFIGGVKPLSKNLLLFKYSTLPSGLLSS
jgi:hypothetical protein